MAEDIHTLVKKAFDETSLVRATDWVRGDASTASGHSLDRLYRQVQEKVVHGKSFYGYGSWYGYLREHHGIERKAHDKSLEQLSVDELNTLVASVIKETGFSSAKEWRDPSKAFKRWRLRSIYIHVCKTRVGGRTFLGYGSWDKYIEKRHGVVSDTRSRLSDEQVHSLIREAIGKTGKSAYKDWRASTGVANGIKGHSLRALLYTAFYRSKNKKPFFGHGTWEEYLEKHHGLRPVVERSWSDERLHYVIVSLLQRHPPDAGHWRESRYKRPQGKSLLNLYINAACSNGDKSKGGFFGHGSWKKYVAWVRQNYSAQ